MDHDRIREDFPFFDHHGEDLVYMDNACQTLRPRQVIDAMNEYYYRYPACGGRSVHRLATMVTLAIDRSREQVAEFLHADPDEIAFTKNATESINVIANGFPLERGDVVLTTDIEHSSNHLPWLRLIDERGIGREFATTDEGMFDLESFAERMTTKVKLVSLVHTSNVTGTTIPARDVVEIAHDMGAKVMLDGSQATPHIPVDLHRLEVDFYAMSLHKMFGPSGVGALYIRKDIQDEVRPLILGGGGVTHSSYDQMELIAPPERFEAGLMNYSGVIGSGPAVRYLMDVGMEEVREGIISLNGIITNGLDSIPEVSLIGPHNPEKRGGIISFTVKGMRSHDVATILDEMDGILVRSGMHCAHPFFRRRGIEGATRASLHIYNTPKECQRFVECVRKMVELFSR